MSFNRILERVRNQLFWILDTVKGGKVRNHLNDIRNIMEDFSTDTSLKIREAHLEALLNHAIESVPFYRKYQGYTSHLDFPVINKSLIRKNFEQFLSEKYKDAKNYSMSTSGSSGTPFHTLQDQNKRLRNRADTIYFKSKAGYSLGDRIYYIRKWFKMHQKSFIQSKLENVYKVEVTEFSDNYLKKLVRRLEDDPSTKILLGYSSALKEICTYLKNTGAKPLKTKITAVIAISEAIGDETRLSLEYYLGAPVLLRYSNLENGILSLELPGEGNLIQINWASYFIELLHPDMDVPVNPGEIGRVVVTDLFNYAMPFIRYDTGDLAVMSHSNYYFNGAPAFKRIEGRKMDMIYDTGGNIISSYIIFHLESYPEIRQFQFMQEGKKDYRFILNVESPYKKEEEIQLLFKRYLGEDANIQFTYKDEIPELSSGKRRLIINNTLPVA